MHYSIAIPLKSYEKILFNVFFLHAHFIFIDFMHIVVKLHLKNFV